jgi:hypothetical protein
VVGYKFNNNALPTAEGTTCSLIVITTDKKQDTQRYVLGISALEKKSSVHI